MKMTPEMWWKNYGLNLEVDTSGMFIYNGIRALDSTEDFSHAIGIFEVLYNLSVGIERLLKVAIVLIEHHDEMELEELEKSLITHNSMELANRVNKQKTLELSKVHKEFLSMISKFYKSHRYGRFSFSSIPNIEEEKRQFLIFVNKHLDLDLSIESDNLFSPALNTTQIKRFIGRVCKKIVQRLYSIICERARELNIYTYEIRSGSKAMKVFFGENLDFTDEEQTKRELLLYLMNPSQDDKHAEFLRSLKALELDSGLSPDYARALIKDTTQNLEYVFGEVEERYYALDNIDERFEMLKLLDKELVFTEEEDS